MPWTSSCFRFSGLFNAGAPFGIPSLAVADSSSSLSDDPKMPGSSSPNPEWKYRIRSPLSCGRGARIVLAVMEAAAAEPVF